MDNHPEEYDLLDLTPIHNVEWDKSTETGLIVLKKPKFKNEILRKYLLPKLKNPFYNVKLDKIGCFVWQKIDGKNKISDIAKSLEEEFGESIHPVNQRLAKFIHSLHKNNFIILLHADSSNSQFLIPNS
jgi:hypothetical protein